jgi:hypothetical protein
MENVDTLEFDANGTLSSQAASALHALDGEAFGGR